MLIERDDVKNGIVFCNRKSEVDIVAKSLKTHGMDAAPIHGDLDQSTRTRTLESFRNGSLKLLVASDVAARGLDIPAVSHVFNYDVPHHADDYVHRIGRTGRAGRLGQAFMITTPADTRNLDKVLKLIGKVPEEITIDLDWANLKDEPRSSRSGGRGGGRERSSSSRDHDRDRRPRPVAAHGEHASTEPFDPSAEVIAPVAKAPAPKRESEAAPERSRSRGRRGGASSEPRPEHVASAEATVEAAPAPAAAPPAREPAAPVEARPPRERDRDRPSRDRGQGDRPQRDRPDRNRRDRDDDNDGVVGFGRDVPAFLSRPPPTSRSDD
jgi:superfamily II DNA/RNA helicase